MFVDQLGLPSRWAHPSGTALLHACCRLVVVGDASLAVTDTANDARVLDSPATTEAGIGAYLGVPVHSPDGHALGALCVLEHDRRRWTEREISTLGDQLTSEALERGGAALAVHEDRTLRYFDTRTYVAEGVERWITTDIACPSPMADRGVPRSVTRLTVLARQGLDRAHSHQAARDHAALLEPLVLPPLRCPRWGGRRWSAAVGPRA